MGGRQRTGGGSKSRGRTIVVPFEIERDIELQKHKRKTCSTCGRSLKLKFFHCHPEKKDGLQSRCKACQTISVKQTIAPYSIKNKKLRPPPAGDSCRVCGKEMKSGDFVVRRASKNGYASRCKLCNLRAVNKSRKKGVNHSKSKVRKQRRIQQSVQKTLWTIPA